AERQIQRAERYNRTVWRPQVYSSYPWSYVSVTDRWDRDRRYRDRYRDDYRDSWYEPVYQTYNIFVEPVYVYGTPVYTSYGYGSYDPYSTASYGGYDPYYTSGYGGYDPYYTAGYGGYDPYYTAGYGGY